MLFAGGRLFAILGELLELPGAFFAGARAGDLFTHRPLWFTVPQTGIDKCGVTAILTGPPEESQ